MKMTAQAVVLTKLACFGDSDVVPESPRQEANQSLHQAEKAFLCMHDACPNLAYEMQEKMRVDANINTFCP